MTTLFIIQNQDDGTKMYHIPTSLITPDCQALVTKYEDTMYNKEASDKEKEEVRNKVKNMIKAWETLGYLKECFGSYGTFESYISLLYIDIN